MDCPTARDQLAGWLDDELAPSARTLLEQHLDRCDPCATLLDRLEARPLRPPTPPALAPAFWATMDEALEDTWDEVLRPAAAEPAGWHNRTVQIRMVSLAAYAAALLLCVSWGMANLAQARDAEAQLAGLQTPVPEQAYAAGQLDPSPTAEPEPPPGASPIAAYTPQRGTF